MKVLDPSQRNRSGRVSMISLTERQILCLVGLRISALLPKLKRHLQCCFDRRRTITTEKDVRQIARADFHQTLRQRIRCRRRHPQRRHVSNFVQLLSDRLVDPRMTMAVNVAPQAGHSVKQLATISRLQNAAFGPLDGQRLILLHLREAMPMGVSRDAGTGVGTQYCGRVCHELADQIAFCGSPGSEKPLRLGIVF